MKATCSEYPSVLVLSSVLFDHDSSFDVAVGILVNPLATFESNVSKCMEVAATTEVDMDDNFSILMASRNHLKASLHLTDHDLIPRRTIVLH